MLPDVSDRFLVALFSLASSFRRCSSSRRRLSACCFAEASLASLCVAFLFRFVAVSWFGLGLPLIFSAASVAEHPNGEHARCQTFDPWRRGRGAVEGFLAAC